MTAGTLAWLWVYRRLPLGSDTAAIPPAPAHHTAQPQPAPGHAVSGMPVDELTEREREILGYLGRGDSNREIGEALFITEGTVKNHVSSILSKLGLRDRTQAALWAREHGLG